LVGNYSEVSAISCTPLDPSKYFSNYILVSYWGSNSVEIFTPESTGFSFVCKTPPLPSLVRSLLLHNFGLDHSSKGPDYHPYLLVGLGDGSIVSFSWKNKQFKDQKVMSLGHAPVCLTTCQVEGRRSVFAAGSRAMVLSWQKKRLHHSPIMLKVNIHAFPNHSFV
jgi:DNA damage-binding protein 1